MTQHLLYDRNTGAPTFLGRLMERKLRRSRDRRRTVTTIKERDREHWQIEWRSHPHRGETWHLIDPAGEKWIKCSKARAEIKFPFKDLPTLYARKVRGR